MNYKELQKKYPKDTEELTKFKFLMDGRSVKSSQLKKFNFSPKLHKEIEKLLDSEGLLIKDTVKFTLEYEPINAGALRLIGYSGSPAQLTVPSNVDGIPVVEIGASAFENCTSLKSVAISKGVKNINSCAFYGCESLMSVTIPNSVVSIGESAFFYCSSLTSITIPDSVTSIGELAFAGCFSLESIDVSVGNLSYSSEDGVLFNKDRTVLMQYPEGKEL